MRQKECLWDTAEVLLQEYMQMKGRSAKEQILKENLWKEEQFHRRWKEKKSHCEGETRSSGWGTLH